jgi:tRNA A-37 threonylcarbamoyl transferase component Bud32
MLDTGDLEGRRVARLHRAGQVEEDHLAVRRAVAVIVEGEDEVVAVDLHLGAARREVEDVGLSGDGLDLDGLARGRTVDDDGRKVSPKILATRESANKGLL